jgi:hypothetical protein
MSSTIAVEELRVGMYIHLDGGWLSHPFPLSSFRIASPNRSTLRGLGLARVRWAPDKSELPPSAEEAAAAAAAAALAPPRARRNGPPRSAASNSWRQREAAKRCERQHAEAARPGAKPRTPSVPCRWKPAAPRWR